MPRFTLVVNFNAEESEKKFLDPELHADHAEIQSTVSRRKVYPHSQLFMNVYPRLVG